MNCIKPLGAIGIVIFVMVACGPAATTPPGAIATVPQVTATVPQATATVPQVTATPTSITQEPVLFPLSQLGPHSTGIRTFKFKDASRDGREVSIAVWYPAVRPAGSTGNGPAPDAAPDLSGAPYPLILSSAKVGDIFAPHLASYGFVVAGIKYQDSKRHWDLWLLDYPLEILFALDQIASNPLEGLEGVVDAEHAGVMGYSFDGYNSLALSGARIDPKFYLAQCAQAATLNPAPPAWWIEYICDLTDKWDEFAARAGAAITTSDDGLWQPMTDRRIRAVMPMAPEGAWLFGARGLAAVDRPTLIIGATNDDINIYDLEGVYIFEHLGTPERTLISFIDQGHMMVYDVVQVARMEHFAAAFFGYYLQGRKDYAGYFSQDFVAQYNDLAWGVYAGNSITKP